MTALEPSLPTLGNPLLRCVLATRPAFLSVTLIAVLLGLAGVHHDGLSVSPLKASLTLLFALLAHAGINVINDYYDGLNGSDAINQDRLFPFTGGSRFIQNGLLSLVATRRLGYGLLASIIPAGLWLTLQSGPGLLLIGLAGLLLGWAYSAPPLQLMCRSLGEGAVTTGFLLIVVGADFVQRGSFAATPWVAGLSYALLVANLLFINQFPDYKADCSAGKRTLVVRLGPLGARWGYTLIALIAHLWLIATIGHGSLPARCAIAALTLILCLKAARLLIAHAAQPAELRPAIQLTILAAHAHGAILAICLAFTRP